MFELSKTKILSMAAHRIGNKNNGEELFLSDKLLNSTPDLNRALIPFFLAPLAKDEFFSFTFSNHDHSLNPLFTFCKRVFENTETLLENSRDIARLLYNLSTHPMIKSGDLLIAHFSNIVVEDEVVDAIGLIKCENQDNFLKINKNNGQFSLLLEEGIHLEKLDKACIVLNTIQEQGYKISIVDRSNKASEAKYWRDDFLQIEPCQDAYFQTNAFLRMTREFVNKELSEEFEMEKADQIDLLNRSMRYFKNNETFEKDEFEEMVLREDQLIHAFEDFDNNRQVENQIRPNQFKISNRAVQKQGRVFKSVLKLDKNFHVYIHGNRELIIRGTDPDGRKFYKLYYEDEN